MKIFNETWFESFGNEADFGFFCNSYLCRELIANYVIPDSEIKYIRENLYKPFIKNVYKPLMKIFKTQKTMYISYTAIRNWGEIFSSKSYIKPILDTYELRFDSKKELKDFLLKVIFNYRSSINSKKFQILLKVQTNNFKFNNIWSKS